MNSIRSYSVSLLILALSSLLLGANKVPDTVPAIPSGPVSVHPGFPRTDPNSIEFGSPSVVDINGDGKLDILVGDGGGCVWAWDRNGKVLPGYPIKTIGSCDGPRINGPIAIGDIDGDRKPEIVAGSAGVGSSSGSRGKVYAWNHDGSIVPGWPKEMDWNTVYGDGHPEVYSVALGNLTGDSRLEVIAGTSNNAAANGGTEFEPTPNLYIWSGDGTALNGFPNWDRGAGTFGLVGVANLAGDGYDEAIVPRDNRYLHVYYGSGASIAGWPVETFVDPRQPDDSPFLEFTRNAPSMGDLDGDGRTETVVAGKVRGYRSDGRPEINSGVLVLEPDGQRSSGWTVAKLGDGPPLYESYVSSQAPALADLDRDGKLEIIVGLNDGTMRAYRSTGEILWKYNYTGGKRLFASEPVVGDINGDQQLEVIFGTYTPDGSAGSSVGLLALSWNGSLLPGFPLGLTHENSSQKKGIRGAPTLADFDGDCAVEILAGSWSGTLYAWDLSAPWVAERMPWPTGRHDLQRSGSYGPSDNQSFLTALFSAGRRQLFLPIMPAGGCQPQ